MRKFLLPHIKISTRVILLGLTVILVFGANVIIMVSAFNNIERLSASIITDGVTAIVENSITSRKMSTILNDSNVLLTNFYRNNDNLQKSGDFLLNDIEDVLSREADELLKGRLVSFRKALIQLLKQCRIMNGHADTIVQLERSYAENLSSLEEHISQVIIDRVLSGDSFQSYEQLGALMPSYRESFLQISLLNLDSSPYFSDPNKVTLLQGKLTTLHLRLRTLLASDIEVVARGSHLLESIENYQATLTTMLEDSEKLRKAIDDLNGAKEQAAEVMSLMDQGVLGASQEILIEMHTISESSLVKIIVMAIVFALFLTVLFFLFITRHIRQPMQSIKFGIEAVSQGDLNTVIQLGRHDEWNAIEKALNRMTSDLRNSYHKLSESNAKLTDMNSEMEHNMLLLEQEVQQRKAVEDSLQKSEERYRLFFEDDLSGAFIADSEGHLLICNRSFLKMLRLDSSDQALELSIVDLFPNLEAYDEFWSELKKKKHLEQFEMELICHDGTLIHTISNVTVTYSGDDVIEIKGYIIDETVRKEAEKRTLALEKQLLHSQKMEALGTLAGGVAHDLNNILTGVVSYPDILLAKMEEDCPYRKPLQIIQDSGKKAAAIVQDLLTLARRGVAMSEVCNMNLIIGEYLKTPGYLQMKSLYPKIEVKLELSDDLENIKGSAHHLTKSIMNLVVNSAESIKTEGEILLKTENRIVPSQGGVGPEGVAPGKYVVLTVKDSGTGIPKKHLNRIFEPFFTKKQMGKSGTGLGLAVVWGAVQDHNGHIFLKSEVGVGTEFNLFFPITGIITDASEKKIESRNLRGNGEKILIIDDNSTQREIVHEMLSELGYQPHAVASGEDAIDYLQYNDSDVLLLDMIMSPGIDGLETYRTILQSKPGQKAIITSGYAETERVKDAQKAGARIYLRKPFSMEELSVALHDELK